MGVDPASSTKQTADYSAIVPVAIDEHNNRYVLPYFRKRIRPVALAEAIFHYFNRYKPEKTKIETVGYQEMLRDYLRRKCEDLNIYIPGLEVKNHPRTNKSVRLEGMQPFFFQKKMFIRKDMEALKNELLMYPRGRHDDLLDGLYYAMKGSYKPMPSDHVTQTLRDSKTKAGYYDWAIL
jgi:phage terminase large subunit-like protein